jgi:hypothetical protein
VLHEIDKNLIKRKLDDVKKKFDVLYNQLVASENLTETSHYMPAVKILLQCCMHAT